MNVVGIVAEYNPFHAGHAWHIEKTRLMLGDDPTVVCAMSGDFVQRGELALYNKFSRAKAACLSGADLVIELPPPWSLASAEGFAQGAVDLLAALGVQAISFGSEEGSLERLEKTAEALLDKSIYEEIRQMQKKNGEISFPAARQRVLEKNIEECSGILDKPNNILAVEYLKAIKREKHPIRALTVAREGNGHDQFGDKGLKSAGELRQMRRRGASITPHIPEPAGMVYLAEQKAGRELIDPELVSLVLLSRLRMLPKAVFLHAPDASDGLGERIYKAAREAESLERVFHLAKTRRYSLARIRRSCLCAAMGISAQESRQNIPYARVLAANERGCALLREWKQKAKVPVITKPAQVHNLSDNCIHVFATGALSHDLYSLCYPCERERKGGMDWRNSPFIVKNE